MTAVSLRRRRFITIAAATAGLPLMVPCRPTSSQMSSLRIWSGVALGADATLQIHHPEPAAADRLIKRSLAEVARLERVFSLYRPEISLVAAEPGWPAGRPAIRPGATAGREPALQRSDIRRV